MTETVARGTTLGTVDGLRLRARARAGVVRRSDRFWRLTRLGLDTFLLTAAAVASNLASPAAKVPSAGYLWPVLFVAVALAVLVSRGAYSRRLMVDLLDAWVGFVTRPRPSVLHSQVPFPFVLSQTLDRRRGIVRA